MSTLYQPPRGRGSLKTAMLTGVVVSALLFLGIPLTQIFTTYEKKPEQIEAIELAAPPPPPPPDEPPPPPEPEKEEPPPELDTPPPPISLEQLEMALNPGTGGSLGGDFALPSFDVNQKDLGGLEIFEIGDVDSAPRPTGPVEFTYPAAAKRRGVTGVVQIEYIVDENGRVSEVTVVKSPDDTLSQATVDVIRKVRFSPAVKAGKNVKVRMRAAIPYK
ncbi:MAG: energy transducer TonB [Verrucomicrobiota bacterium]